MARCLSEELITYQKLEEIEIMKIGENMDEAGKELLRKFYEPLVSTSILRKLAPYWQIIALQKITVDDLSREYSPADVKQLCLRTKVRVDMTLYNCVHDAKIRFEKAGRLANRSERTINALLKKAVGRMVAPYTPEEIAKGNHIRQCELKKENNFRLDRWRYESSQSRILESSSSGTTGHQSLPPAQVPNAQEEDEEEEIEMLIFETTQDTETRSPSTGETHEKESQSSSIGELLNEPEMPEGGKVVHLDIAPKEGKIATENTSANMDWVEAAVQCNSQSMTVDTEEIELLGLESSQSQPTPEDYIVFDTQVPATSTQSQCSEELL